MTFFRKQGFFKGVFLPMAALLLVLALFQNCSMANFGGKRGPTYNANGDGHEGKLSIPIDHTVAQDAGGYQSEILFNLNSLVSTNSSLDRIGYYCRSQQVSDQEGLDIVISKAASTWSPVAETYSFANGVLPFNSVFNRGSSASYVDAAGVLRFVAVNQPRLINSPEGVSGILLEAASTNSVLQSQGLNESLWANFGAEMDIAVASLAPDGISPAFQLIEIADPIPNRSTRQEVAVTAETHTFSVFTKSVAPGRLATVQMIQAPRDSQICGLNFTSGDATLLQGVPTTICKAEALGDGWFRLSVITALDAGVASVGVGLADPVNGVNYESTAHPGVLFWGAQLEVGNQASSYIVTDGVPVTRDADEITLRSSSTSLSEANWTAEYSLASSGSKLNFNMVGVNLVTTAAQIEGTSVTNQQAFWANHQELGAQKLNGQVDSEGFKLYGNGAWVGDLNESGLSLGSIQVSSSVGVSYLTLLTVEDQALRQEIMAVNSLVDRDDNSAYGVLVLGRESDRVQTHPVPLISLAGDSLTGQEHHFDLVEMSDGNFDFEGSLDDGTFLNETMNCLPENAF